MADWIEWNGGENPVPGAVVDVQLRDEATISAAKSETLVWSHKEGDMIWCDQVIAYRVVEPAAPAVADTDKTVGLDWSEHEDEISDAICDSMDMDWTSRDGAKAVVLYLQSLATITTTVEDDTPPPADPALLASANRALKAQLDERDEEIAALRDAAVELIAAANGLVDCDVQYHEGEIRIPGVGHGAAIHRVRELRQATQAMEAILAQPKGDA